MFKTNQGPQRPRYPFFSLNATVSHDPVSDLEIEENLYGEWAAVISSGSRLAT